MSRALRSAADLVAAGLVDATRQAAIEAVGESYAIALTRAVVDLIDPADPNDPIARQFVPDPRELVTTPEERADPIGDEAFSPVPGVVHRYPDRVLLKLVHACPVYCRFCFRRETVGPGGANHLSDAALDAAFGYVAARPEIWEVILTGGDPLMLSLRHIADIVERLARLDHVKILRLHTRVPSVDPARVTPELVALLRGARQTVYVALHANHARELGPAAAAACALFGDAGIPMLSQSVLLRGVNDDAATLAALMRRFVELRVKPYYLHHPDLAPGTAHFRLSIEAGRALVRALRGNLSGLAQPHYVLDIPGGAGKSPIGPNYVENSGPDSYQITDFAGLSHFYPPR